MPRDPVSRTANVGTWLRKHNGRHKWVNETCIYMVYILSLCVHIKISGIKTSKAFNVDIYIVDIYCICRYILRREHIINQQTLRY